MNMTSSFEDLVPTISIVQTYDKSGKLFRHNCISKLQVEEIQNDIIVSLKRKDASNKYISSTQIAYDVQLLLHMQPQPDSTVHSKELRNLAMRFKSEIEAHCKLKHKRKSSHYQKKKSQLEKQRWVS